jgi:hypothetical protein
MHPYRIWNDGADIMYVYILSTYAEHGATDATATLDRAKLADMMDANWPLAGDEYPEYLKTWLAEAKAGLSKELLQTDEELSQRGRDGINLQSGWGGMQLHVVKLFTGA